MKASTFKKLLEQVAVLSKRQREQLLQVLRSTVGLDRFTEVIEQAKPASTCCPACGAARFHRHGRAHGLQRYRCLTCGRTFTVLTGTPLSGLRHKEKWLDFLDCVLNSTTVRGAARSVGVHRNTSFRWRHRFLDVTKHDRPDTLTGIAEADELYLLESHKGSRNLLRPPRKHGGAATKRGISDEQVCVLVARFHGVATRYLPNYLGWRWALDGNRLDSPDALLRAAIGIFNTQR